MFRNNLPEGWLFDVYRSEVGDDMVLVIQARNGDAAAYIAHKRSIGGLILERLGHAGASSQPEPWKCGEPGCTLKERHGHPLSQSETPVEGK